MIDMRKKYQTRSGLPVEIVTTSARGSPEWPVMGYVSDWKQFSFWSPDGLFDVNGARSNLDLVEVTPERVMWLNTYPNDYVYMYRSREEADANSAADRIARLKVEFREGQFDE